MNVDNRFREATPGQLRDAIRSREWTGPTAGLAAGYVQANVVILPRSMADDFAEFCDRNPQACPLLEQTAPGDPQPRQSAPGADLRTDVPRYRVFRDGIPDSQEPTDVSHLWRDDLVGFLLGCSFTFESALIAAGLPVRHIEQKCNVPMFRASVPCQPAGALRGPLVVSMRPYKIEDVERVIEVTRRYPRMHGAPVHVGDPAALGIDDIHSPDFGDAVPVHDDEVPVFWACGVTPQLAILEARPSLAITHSPGCMFVTDWEEAEFFDPL